MVPFRLDHLIRYPALCLYILFDAVPTFCSIVLSERQVSATKVYSRHRRIPVQVNCQSGGNEMVKKEKVGVEPYHEQLQFHLFKLDFA